LDIDVNTDFAGLWNFEEVQDDGRVRSRTKFLVTLRNSPVCWTSQRQTQIATSFMEAEYIALSQSVKQLIPLRHLYGEIIKHMNLPVDNVSKISTVFEDILAALILGNSTDPPHLSPWSKYIAGKYH
jgi:hypothetical protein